ncbi:acid protease [Tilletiaria anomala UBC 951]|uniref:Acid protease n=1 Tax=Tilletiaria anomala (strain ATCC 24038 / CBS 436.72 / UBC 951) TaxID=1037660 RepID=A0A066VZZ0_TILAU|nr:acid protease [Tilletiaria anomala UBC 951]KDN44125.1 acid protease [Tilletiaria anomala UBC 951]
MTKASLFSAAGTLATLLLAASITVPQAHGVALLKPHIPEYEALVDRTKSIYSPTPDVDGRHYLPQPRAEALRPGGRAVATRRSTGGGGVKVPIKRFDKYAGHRRDGMAPDEVKAWALKQKHYIAKKWGSAFKGGDSAVKRNGGQDVTKLDRRGIAALTNVDQDTYYYADVSMGTPAQSMALVLDTGSSDLWVATSECSSNTCSSLSKFSMSNSSTYQSSSQVFSITYGSGAVTGHMAGDTITLGDYTVYSQSFAVAQQVAQDTISAPASGIMGLGFQELSTAGVTPWWEVLAKEGVLETNAFTFQLTRTSASSSSSSSTSSDSSTTKTAGGVFTIGAIDTDQYSGTINYVSIPSQYQSYGYWSIMLDSYALGGGSSTSIDSIACIDTGTTLIATTYTFAASLYEQISGSKSLEETYGEEGLYAFPCDSTVSLTLSFGGVRYTMDGADFNAGAVDSKGEYCLGAVFGSSNGGSSTPAFIIGDAFLKSWFSVFDYDKKAVGFASLKGGSAQTVVSSSSAASVATTIATAAVTARQFGGPGLGGPGGFTYGSLSSTSEVWTTVTASATAATGTGTGIYWASGISAPTASGATSLSEKLSSSAAAHAAGGAGAAGFGATALICAAVAGAMTVLAL